MTAAGIQRHRQGDEDILSPKEAPQFRKEGGRCRSGDSMAATKS